ncbi:hypothetical protein V6N13_016405 [Hibiscus sabdariffa]
MESKLKPWELVAIPLLLALLNLQNLASAVPQVPSYFIFGDSISDSGNNNKLAKLAKVNYPPYGIDFPEGPTGRYSNGRTVHDFIDYMLPFAESNEKNIFNGVNYASGATGIRDETGQHRFILHGIKAQAIGAGGDSIVASIVEPAEVGKCSSPVKLLGFEEYMPPFAESEGKDVLNGVNYASGASGILDETGKHRGIRIPLNDQIRNHKTIISRITTLMGNESATKSHLSQCIYSVQIGSNDYINNYFKPESYDTSNRYAPPEYANVLVQQLSDQLKSLYDSGARKFAVYGLGMIGCTPDARAVHGTKGTPCVEKFNEGSTPFNERLMPLIDQLNKNLTEAKFTFLNPFGSIAGLVTDSPCCKIGGGGGELCLPNSKPCDNRNKYIFWDGVHPTDAWNEMIGKSAYSTEKPQEAQPFNIQKLALQKIGIHPL